jgi:hypothetical protein
LGFLSNTVVRKLALLRGEILSLEIGRLAVQQRALHIIFSSLPWTELRVIVFTQLYVICVRKGEAGTALGTSPILEVKWCEARAMLV